LSDRFNIPEKLYGREAEVQTLLTAFDRVAEGGSELMLVAGFSGIGKTAVVNEVHKPITRQQGYFIKGKFDQFNRNIPLSAFVQALRDLMGQLRSESDVQLAQWKMQILAAVGENGQVLIEVIPELEQIIGQQPTASELSGIAAQNRFNLLFQKFIEVFTTREHPLVLFLDDLQWADSASLQLVKLLMNDKMNNNGYLLLLGAYRDNEVSPAHPFILTVDELRKAAIAINTITLAPLDAGDVNHLIADTLSCPIALAQPLTELVMQKTKGNPFFLTQFLKALHEEGLIAFNQAQCYWECNIAAVKERSLTDDVVEFMAQQLQKLSPATQAVLKLAACIGNQFDLQTLAIVSNQSSSDAAAVLWQALQEGLILPTSQVYKFFQAQDQDQETVNPTYRFLHDRVQQAAYLLIPEVEKAIVHQTLGKLFLEHWSASEQEERIFEIVNHLNQAIHLVELSSEREHLAQLNLKAGQKAKAATAYAAALNYLTHSADLLPQQAWQQHYGLTLLLHTELANNTCLNGDFEATEHWLNLALSEVEPLLDRIPFYEIQIQAHVAQNRPQEAIQLGCRILQQLGVELPTQPTPEDFGRGLAEINAALGDRPVADLIHLPPMTDPQLLAGMRVLLRLAGVVVLAAPHLMPFIFFKMVGLSMQCGNSPFSAPGYATFGMILCSAVGQPDLGYAFGQLSLAILDQFPSLAVQAKTLSRFHGGVRHWKDCWRNILPELSVGYQLGLETGDLETTAIFAQLHGYTAYFSGMELPELVNSIATYSQAIAQLKQPVFLRWNQTYHQHVLNLLGEADDPCQLVGTAYDETVDLPQQYAIKDAHGIAVAHLFKAIGCYLFEQPETALTHLEQVTEFHRSIGSFIPGTIFYFYDALARLAVYPDLTAEAQAECAQKITADREKIQQLTTHAAVNWSHKADLVTAQWQAMMGNRVEAIDLYDRAIATANANGYIQEEALANELAAKFYLNWGREKVAASYLQDAYYCYARWGAKAKINQLEQRYPHLLQPILQPVAQSFNPLETLASIAAPSLSLQTTTASSHPSSTSMNQLLDFATLLQASQSLASTIQLEELLQQLTTTILQNSGGDYCVVLLPSCNYTSTSSQEWQVRAIATPHHTELHADPLTDHANLPVKLIQYVKNTQSSIILNDFKTDLPIFDEYLQQQRPRSILCTPILNQGHLIGILYLHNQTTSDVFTRDRLLVLNFLCTQAAISLENARLYQQSQTALQNLQQSKQLLRNIIDTIPQVVFWKDRNSTYLGCNQAFATIAGVSSVEAIVGKTDYDMPWSREESDVYRADDRQVMEANQPKLHIIETQQQLDGSTNWLDTSKIPLCDEMGEVYGVIGTLEDISERKAAEQTILQKSQALEQALQDLQNAQLQTVQSEKMASLGNLVAGVAHEVNNPIGFLNGSINNAKDYVKDLLEYIELYQQHYPTPVEAVQAFAEEIDLEFLQADLPKLLDSMKGATDRIKGISNSLRTFSRADTEHKVNAHLHEGLDSTLLILKYRLKANEFRPAIAIVQNYGELPAIDCFPGQLNQVFMNILANAIDMFDEIAQVQPYEQLQANPQILTLQTEQTDNQVMIRIRDNGKGMDEVTRSRIFDHLFTTKEVGKGTGLGLAIARQIVVEKHGGSLEVQSTVGQGTEFCICLPMGT
jgi:PAS domain S-box-containing protein